MELGWLTESVIRNFAFASIAIEFLFYFYMYYRQRKAFIDARYEELPAELKKYYSPELFEKSRRYEISYNKYDACMTLSYLLKSTSYLYFLYYARMWRISKKALSATKLWPSNFDEEVGTTLCYHAISTVISELTGVPFYLYQQFVIEKSNGFNRNSLSMLRYLWNFMFSLMMSLLFYSPLAAGLVFIVKHTGVHFFFFLVIYQIVSDIFLSYIFPMFKWQQYARLKQGPLRTRLEKLANKVGFPFSEIYIRTSESSDHLNAYLDGIFTNKRIVLNDSLIDDDRQANDEDIEKIAATVAHELGHWNALHPFQLYLSSQLKTIFPCLFFVILYQHEPMFQAFGFRNGERPVWIACEIIIYNLLNLYTLVTDKLDRLFGRALEREADKYAVRQGLGIPLKIGLCQDYAENLNFPLQDPVCQFLEGSHPTLLERIDNIDNELKKMQ